MENAMVAWLLETYEAKRLIQGKEAARGWLHGAEDAVVHLVTLSRQCSAEEARTWVAEEHAERLASMG